MQVEQDFHSILNKIPCLFGTPSKIPKSKPFCFSLSLISRSVNCSLQLSIQKNSQKKLSIQKFGMQV
uniref:Uncharacterized protein n=1 Tax=Cannabis sativa TaxID=3483 RepID=A0A803R8K0_CANSA